MRPVFALGEKLPRENAYQWRADPGLSWALALARPGASAPGQKAEHKKNGRAVEGEGWSEGAEEGRRREPPELCARPV